MGECTRSGFCNFMHLKPISRDLRRILYGRDLEQEEAPVAVITKVILMEENFLGAMDQAETEDVEVEVVIAAIVESVVDLQEVERVEQEDTRLEFNVTIISVNGI